MDALYTPSTDEGKEFVSNAADNRADGEHGKRGEEADWAAKDIAKVKQ